MNAPELMTKVLDYGITGIVLYLMWRKLDSIDEYLRSIMSRLLDAALGDDEEKT